MARDDGTREGFNLSLGDDDEGRGRERCAREGKRKRKGKNEYRLLKHGIRPRL